MWECKNASEPMDLKLMTILFLRKIWLPILTFFAGAIIVGGIYFVAKVVFAPNPEYRAITEFYVDYTANADGEYKYYALNPEGWESIIKTEAVLGPAMEQFDFEITLETLRNSITVNPRTDHRFSQIAITYVDKEQTVEIANAIEQSLMNFARQMRECENVRILTSAKEANLVLVDTYTLRAALLGGIIVALLTLFLMWFSFLLDDSIYIPIMFEKRYQIPVFDINHIKQSEVVCLELGEETLKEKEKPVVLLIDAGKRNGKLIEKAIYDLKKANRSILGAVIKNQDEKLIRQYYFGIRRG